MFEIGKLLQKGIKKLFSKVLIDKKTIDEFVKDVQRALIIGDVDVSLVFKLTKEFKEKIKKEKRKEQIVRILYEELVSILGKGHEFEVREKPHKILLVGLFGAGKTTTAGKLALKFKKRGYKVCLLALDTFRAAAINQLRQIAEKINVPIIFDEKEKNPAKIIKKFESEFKKYDIIIGDSAGRSALDKELIKEIKEINKKFKPNDTWLVIPADIGQAVKEQARAFKENLNITGVIISKFDSTAKGGGALTACAEVGAPVKFIGTGEGMSDLEKFNPKGFVSRLLGMGDLEALLEKAQEELDEEKMKDLGERVLSGNFNLIDLYEQLRAMNKLGSIKKLLGFLPSMPLPIDKLNIQEEYIKKFQYIMDSMTKEELENPKILNRSRIERIAKGSGTTIKDVRELIKQYNQMKNLIKKMSGKSLKRMLKKLGIKDLSAFEEMIGGQI